MPRGRSARIFLSFATPLLLLAVPAAASPPLPPEVQNVSLFSATVSWDATPGAVAYRTYRVTPADLPNFCAGGSSIITGTDFDDLQLPPVGGVFVYLVTTVNSAGEGSAGQSTAGAPRDGSFLCDSDSDGVTDDTDLCPDDADPNQDDLDFDGVGDACQFDASGVQLSGRIPRSGFPVGGAFANEMWGYVSPAGEEYGIIGFRNGTAFVRVTNPLAPGLAGYIDGAGVNQPWRDMAVFGEYAYIISDGNGVGLQIVDLTGIDNDVVTLANTTTLGVGFTDGHNIFVNESTGFLYLGIPDLNSGLGLTAVDLNTDPVNPTVAGTWTDTDFGVRCHDFQVLSYTGGPVAGREIAYCFAEDDGLRIVDVTSKTAMVRLAKLNTHPDWRYTHQGWITEDRQYLLIGDELDERDVPAVGTTTTYVVDVSDPSAPVFTTSFTNGLQAIDHNMMVRGDFVYEANYSSGLRIFSICNINNVQEIGHLDTHPETDGTVFAGAWGVYSQLPSGTVVVSDIQRGLFVLEPSSALARVNDKCSSLGSHDPVCDPCIDQICTSDPSCCTTAWDAPCIESVRTLCSSLICDESAGACAHTLCSEGAALTLFCDTPPAATSCVDAICQVRPSCCLAAWDATCVDLVDSTCGLSCD